MCQKLSGWLTWQRDPWIWLTCLRIGMIRFATKRRILKDRALYVVISRIHVPDVMTSSSWTGVIVPWLFWTTTITISGYFIGVIYACNEIVWKLPLESFGLVWLRWPLKRRSDSSQGFRADSQEYPCWLFFWCLCNESIQESARGLLMYHNMIQHWWNDVQRLQINYNLTTVVSQVRCTGPTCIDTSKVKRVRTNA